MTYAEALEQVKPLIVQHEQYAVVSNDDARQLMGDERFARFTKDKIINLGPHGFDGVYFWNAAAGMVKVWEDFQ